MSDKNERRRKLLRQRAGQAETRFHNYYSGTPTAPFDFQQFVFTQPDLPLITRWRSFDARAKKIVERCFVERYANESQTPHFHWVTMGSPNAFATTDGEFDSVAFSAELWLTAFCTVNTLFAHPDAFKNVGNIGIETRPTMPGRSLFSLSVPVDNIRIPYCPIRQMVAGQIITDLTDFVLEHEIQHILRGHVGLLCSNHSSPILATGASVNGMPTANEIALLRQALEAQADGPALSICVRQVLFDNYPSRESLIAKGMDGETYDEIERTVRPDRLTRMYWLFVSLSIYFAIIGRERQKLNLSTSGHPPSFMRLHMAATDLKATLVNNNGLPECRDKIGLTVGRALGDASEAMKAAFSGDNIDYTVKLPGEPFGSNYYGTLGKQLEAVQPLLEQFQRDSFGYGFLIRLAYAH